MKAAEREQARRLRSQGFSIKEICKQLRVAKSSVSNWVRGIELTADQIQALQTNESANRNRFSYLSRLGGANRNKADAEIRHKAFRNKGFQRAQSDSSVRVICALYWGEGQKSLKIFGGCNSDPTLLKVIFRWLIQEGYDEATRFTVRYHPDNGLTEEEIRNWWLQQLPGLEPRHLRKFGICLVNRVSQRKKQGKLPYGTATIEVCRTELHYNILGGIDYLRTTGDW